jgi:2-methylisocitrate lyase-like PEP mutase family enzyme
LASPWRRCARRPRRSAGRKFPFSSWRGLRTSCSAGRPDLADTIRRLQAFQEAGADVLYAPGLSTADEVRAVVSSVDRPVNVVMGLVPSALTVADLDTLGVARISIGSALARRAYGAVLAAGREMLEAGTFGFALEAAPLRDLEAMF